MEVACQVKGFIIIERIDGEEVFLNWSNPFIYPGDRTAPRNLVFHQIVPSSHTCCNSNTPNDSKYANLFHKLFSNGFCFSWLIRVVTKIILEFSSVNSSLFVNDFAQ